MTEEMTHEESGTGVPPVFSVSSDTGGTLVPLCASTDTRLRPSRGRRANPRLGRSGSTELAEVLALLAFACVARYGMQRLEPSLTLDEAFQDRIKMG